jgi:hypothetical protein
VLNSPAGYDNFLGDLPAGVAQVTEASGTLDWLCLFVQNRAELAHWSPIAIGLVKRDGLFWIAYPKGGAKAKTDLNRDSLWKLMEPSGLRPVAMVAIDATWSAMRFRPAELVEAR